MSSLENKDVRKIVVFSLDAPRYALYLFAVEKVVQATEITPLPKAPEKIAGVINIQGKIIPVIAVRRLFRLPAREINLDDQFIIARTSKRFVALLVDSVAGVYELSSDQVVKTESSLPFADYLSGVSVLENDIILINDLEKFLSFNEQNELDAALKDIKK